MTEQRIVSFPSAELLEAAGPLPENLRGVVWDVSEEQTEVEVEAIDIAVLPYMADLSQLQGIHRATNLSQVQTQTTGYDGFIELVGERATITTAGSVHAAATAEMALGLAIASLRGFPDAVRNQATGTWAPQRWPGLADRTVAIVGAGRIGDQIRRRLEPFEVNLLRFASSSRSDEHGQIHSIAELGSLAPQIEVLILIVPLTDSTHHLVNAELLALLPDGARVINVARGPVVDTEALTREVASGRLFVASDVFDPEPLPADHELWKQPNALILPHNGGNTEAFFPRMVALLKRQLQAWSEGELGENVVHNP